MIRAVGVIGDPLDVPWPIGRMRDAMLARGAGDAFETITGADLMALSLDRPPPSPLPSGPTDDQADANVTLDSDEGFGAGLIRQGRRVVE